MNLFIDTHLNEVIIILFDEKKIIKKMKISNEKQNSKLIMPTIEKILGKNKPKSIIVVNGPGSFTGVRLGVTIAKTMAYVLNVPIRTISSLECMAVTLDCDERIVAFSDKNGYYIGIFNYNCELIGTYEYLSNKEFEEYSKDYNVFTNLKLDYKKIIDFALKKDTLIPHEVNPIYIKKLDVEK